MNKKLLAPLALLVALSIGATARAADDDANAVLKKAIAAQGGAKLLDKYVAFEQEFEGTIDIMGMKIKFKMQMWGQSPDKMKSQISFEINNMEFKMIRAVDGKSGWMSLNGMIMDLPKDELTEGKRELRAAWLSGQLTPLLDKKYTLQTIGEKKIDGKPSVGILVKEKGSKDDISLFFDKKTHFLVGMEHNVKDIMGGGEEVTQSMIFSDYKKDKCGINVPWGAVIQRDGKTFITGKVTSSRMAEKLNKSVFAKPD